jgi:hypothetical protein
MPPTLTFFSSGQMIDKAKSLITNKRIAEGEVLIGMVSRPKPFVFKRFDPNYDFSQNSWGNSGSWIDGLKFTPKKKVIPCRLHNLRLEDESSYQIQYLGRREKRHSKNAGSNLLRLAGDILQQSPARRAH